jgi:hypothetical protein
MKELSFYFQSSGITSIHFKDLPKYITQRFPGVRSFRELDYFEADIRTCSFLKRDALGNYSFIHPSFCEYFSALCAFEYLIAEKWPPHLWTGRSKIPTSWITPETAKFLIDLFGKGDVLNKILLKLYKKSLNGLFIIILLSAFKHGDAETRRPFFDYLYWLKMRKNLKGLDFRIEIEQLADEYHTEKWKDIEKDLIKHQK